MLHSSDGGCKPHITSLLTAAAQKHTYTQTHSHTHTLVQTVIFVAICSSPWTGRAWKTRTQPFRAITEHNLRYTGSQVTALTLLRRPFWLQHSWHPINITALQLWYLGEEVMHKPLMGGVQEFSLYFTASLTKLSISMIDTKYYWHFCSLQMGGMLVRKSIHYTDYAWPPISP